MVVYFNTLLICAKNIDYWYLKEAVLTRTHNLCILKCRNMNTPINPSFTTLNWGARGINYIGVLAL